MTATSADAPLLTFDQRIKADFWWALAQFGLFFNDGGAREKTLRRLARAFEDRGIHYALAGRLGYAVHGSWWGTPDLDVVVTSDGLGAVNEIDWLRGVRRTSSVAVHRDLETDVKVRFVVANSVESVHLHGIRVLPLPRLLERSLRAADESRGLAHAVDVQQAIELIGLPLDYAELLKPEVRERYRGLWAAMHGPRPDWEEPNVT